MKKLTLIILLTLLLSLLVVNLASAAAGNPVGACKRGWKMITLPGNVSSGTDKNGDGYVCTSTRGGKLAYIDNFNLTRASCVTNRYKFTKFK